MDAEKITKISLYLLFLLIISPFIYSLGFEGYYNPVDPIPCGGIETFEDDGEYLRDVYVDFQGTTDGDGTENNPYNKLESAAASALPGDIIHVTGTSFDSIYIIDLRGTLENPIQILGENAKFMASSACMHLVRPYALVVRNVECVGADNNGFNFDDSGDYSNPHSAEYILFDNLTIHEIGTGGNQDPLKISGLNNFFVMNSNFYDNSLSGSTIDMVGCHDGIIINNRFVDSGSNFIQAKGGSRNVTIHGNYFKNVESRGVNMGGGTGVEFFRVPLNEMGEEPYEAKHIRVTSNIFIRPYATVAYAVCDECLAANNLFYEPSHWIFRILQDSTTKVYDGEVVEFIPTRRGEFLNNIIVFNGNEISALINIGQNTESESFRLQNNIWYALDNANYDFDANWPSSLPDEINPYFNVDPMFRDSSSEDFALLQKSPAIANGIAGWVNTDFNGVCFYSNDIGPFANGEYEPPVIECNPVEIICGNGVDEDCDAVDEECLCSGADSDNDNVISRYELKEYIKSQLGSMSEYINMIKAIIEFKEGCK